MALHKGRPLRNIHFLPACLSGSRLGHNPFSFVHWALGPWGRNSGQESDSFLDSVARLGQQTMFVRHWMGGYGKKKRMFDLNEMTDNRSLPTFKLLRESPLAGKRRDFSVYLWLLAYLEGSVFEQ